MLPKREVQSEKRIRFPHKFQVSEQELKEALEEPLAIDLSLLRRESESDEEANNKLDMPIIEETRDADGGNIVKFKTPLKASLAVENQECKLGISEQNSFKFTTPAKTNFLLKNQQGSSKIEMATIKENGGEINGGLSTYKYTTPAKNNFGIRKQDFRTPSQSSEKTRSSTWRYKCNTPSNVKDNPQQSKVQCSIAINSMRTPQFKRVKTPVPFISTPKNIEQITHSDNKENKSLLPENNLISTSRTISPRLETVTVNGINYFILNQLGKGGSSVVYNCYNPEEKTQRAIKCVSLDNSVSAQGYINEVQLLQSLQKCKRVIKMYDYEKSGNTLFVVLEVGGADLSKILKDLSASTEHLSLYMLMYYWMEMLLAVEQIHKNGVVHTDLKPANFLLTESGIKLIDFGIACQIQSDMTSVFKNVAEGSYNYISPEAISNEPSSNINSPNYRKLKFKVNSKSDVWSLGCILYQLVYRQTPFHNIGNVAAKLSAIMDPLHVINYPKTNFPAELIDTIKSCLRYDNKSRPSIKELIADYWIR